mmetsp:Transcript_67581/g.208939  ORF Transcript_67581/g.208939 Transcript_67581/m.208939 type:complete len:441 (+) Transcript_67581:230-1552(+)
MLSCFALSRLTATNSTAAAPSRAPPASCGAAECCLCLAGRSSSGAGLAGPPGCGVGVRPGPVPAPAREGLAGAPWSAPARCCWLARNCSSARYSPMALFRAAARASSADRASEPTLVGVPPGAVFLARRTSSRHCLRSSSSSACSHRSSRRLTWSISDISLSDLALKKASPAGCSHGTGPPPLTVLVSSPVSSQGQLPASLPSLKDTVDEPGLGDSNRHRTSRHCAEFCAAERSLSRGSAAPSLSGELRDSTPEPLPPPPGSASAAAAAVAGGGGGAAVRAPASGSAGPQPRPAATEGRAERARLPRAALGSASPARLGASRRAASGGRGVLGDICTLDACRLGHCSVASDSVARSGPIAVRCCSARISHRCLCNRSSSSPTRRSRSLTCRSRSCSFCSLSLISRRCCWEAASLCRDWAVNWTRSWLSSASREWSCNCSW